MTEWEVSKEVGVDMYVYFHLCRRNQQLASALVDLREDDRL